MVEFEDEETEVVYKAVYQIPAHPGNPMYGQFVSPDWFASLEGLEGDFKAEVVAIAGDKNATISEAEFEVD